MGYLASVAAHDLPVTFSSGGRAVRGNLFLPDHPPKASLLFVHGLHSNRAGYLQRAASASRHLGAATLAFDLSGHGESDGQLGQLTPADHLHDVLAAYDFLGASVPETALAAPRVGVCGASYGAYLSALLPSARAVWRLLLRAPAMYPDELFHLPLDQQRHTEVARSPSMLIRSSGAFPGRLLVVESEDDTVIPHDVVEQYLALFPRVEHATLVGAEHALVLPEHKAEFLALILDWFGRAGP